MVEKQTLIVLSTAHLSHTSRAWISEAGTLNHAASYHGERVGASIGTLGATLNGWFMWAPRNWEDQLPPEINTIVNFAHSQGADYILFDADAGTVRDLPTFEW